MLDIPIGFTKRRLNYILFNFSLYTVSIQGIFLCNITRLSPGMMSLEFLFEWYADGKYTF
jgi:hypothetical protein